MHRIIIVALFLVLQGCSMTTKPDRDVEYAFVKELDSVTGCYQNLGEREANTANIYLSQIFWPGLETQHDQIQLIEISLVSDESVIAQAFSDGKLIKQSVFLEGQHFELKSGKIVIKNELFGSLAYPADNPFIGVGHSSVVLGIDQSGNGKLTKSDSFAGTAFLFIPVAGQVSDSVRFVRTGKSCIES